MKRLFDVRIWQIAAVALVVFAVFESFQSQAEARRVADKARTLAVQFKKDTGARQRAAQIATHSGCVNLNFGRGLVRTFSGDQLNIVFNAQVPGQIRTPEEQATIDRTVAAVLARAAAVFYSVDCDREAPLPPDMTDAERAQMPQPRTVPPLHLPAPPAVPVVTVPQSKGTPTP